MKDFLKRKNIVFSCFCKKKRGEINQKPMKWLSTRGRKTGWRDRRGSQLLLLGILLRNFNNNKSIINNKNNNITNNFGIIFINSIKHTIDTLLTILGTLTCFLIISNIIVSRLNLNSYNSVIVKSLLEITMGIKELSTLNIKDIYKVVLSTIFLSFGGLSIHTQVISQICYTKIKYKYFFIGRIFQSIISGIISFIIYYIIL